MRTYLNNLITEKTALDMDMILEVEGPSGLNIMPLAVLVDAILSAPVTEQKAIRTMLVKSDFVNGKVEDYFTHLAQAIAV